MDATSLTGSGPGAGVVPVLVERDRELATIAGALERAASGAGGVVMVEGDPGIGKTRLLMEARAGAEARGMRCLRARGAELERHFTFGVVRQLLEAELERPGMREKVLNGAAAAAAPVLGAQPEFWLPPQDHDSALLHGIYWTCIRLSEERPTALLVDDLQWADGPSLDALDYLARRVEGHPLILILASRTGGASSRGRLLELATESRLQPAALSPTGSGRVLKDLLGSLPAEFSDTAHRISGGNPFLLREIALVAATEEIQPDRASAERLAELGPASIADWALARLARLPPAARAVASSLAVLEPAELRVLAAHTRLDPSDAGDAADQLAAAGLVDPALPLRFAHPIVRTALYEQLTPAARDDSHHRAAEALHEIGAGAEQVAAHLLEAEPRDAVWAASSLREAAGLARARGGSGEAIAFLRRALVEPGQQDDPSLLLELGLAELSASDPDALEHLEAAARRDGPQEMRGTIHGAVAQSRYLAGDTLGAFEAVRTALDAIPEGTGGALEAELLLSYGIAGRPRAELIPEVRRRLAVPRPDGAGEPTPAEVVRRHLLALDGYLRGERETAAGARWAAARMSDPALAPALPSLTGTGPAFVLAGLDAHGEAAEVIAGSLERSRRRGSRLETAEALHDRVWSRWRRGDLYGGLADCETIFAMTEGAWEVAKLPLRAASGYMLVERGDLEGASAVLDLPDELETRLRGTWGWGWISLARARLAIAHREWLAALELSLTAGRRLMEIDAPSAGYCWWRSLAARAAHALGQTERALELADEELRLGRAVGSARAIGSGLATAGAVSEPGEGVEMLRESLASLEAAGAELERARALAALGLALRRARHQREARDPLREALDVSRRLGAAPLAKLALGELRAAGGRPRRERSSGVQSLTPREHQVAELAASGLPNPAIAERLFITRKTVEAHLRAVYRKLDVSSREQLSGLDF